MKKFLPFILICSLPVLVVSQNDEEKEKLIEKYFYKALAASNTHKDSSYFYYERALKYTYELENHSDALEVLFGLIMTSRKYADLENHQLFLSKIDSLLKMDSVKNDLDDFTYYQNRFDYEKGTYLYGLKDYVTAKPFFQKLFNSLSKKESTKSDLYDYSILVHSINHLALIYGHTQKYELAEDFFDRALSFIEENPIDESETYRLATLQLLAQQYRFTENYPRSNEILEKILTAYRIRYMNDKDYKNNINAAYHKLAENAIDQDSLAKALSYLQEGEKYFVQDDSFYKKYLLLYGNIQTDLSNSEEALEYYLEALKAYKKYRQSKPHQDIAEVYGKIAELHLKRENYQVGLETIKKAFFNTGNNIQLTKGQENPNPEGVFSKTQLLHLLDVKLQLLRGICKSTGKDNYLEFVILTVRDLLNTFNLLKMEFDSKLDKEFLAETAYPIFHRMMASTYEAFQVDKSVELVQLALDIGEKNKDFLLLEALRSTQASRYGIIPQELLNKEAQLCTEITYLEKEIFDANETNDGFSESLFMVKQEYYSFLDSIKLHYPKYHSLKYQTTAINLETIRQKLIEDNGILVSYTLTDSHLYTIVVNDKIEKFLKIPFSDSDRQMIRDFYKLLSRPSVNATEKPISELGKTLYEKLLKTPLTGLDIKNLMVIPDGELHYLPFDLLVKDDMSLLESMNISYANSVASLLELKQKQHDGEKNVLAFAPTFSGLGQETVTRDFGKLLYNDDEVQQIHSYFETDVYSDSMATLENFMSFAPNENMIHLATHASANDEFPDYSYLAFSQITDEDNILYIKDLYNMSLNADMVTLSACQTGIGKLQKGQGMMSLSKGFYYAGAKSLVNTLWKINDKSTVKLMEFFYEGLSKGKSKTEALREAKLKYLESTDDNLLRHPYYWAAFVVSGDIAPISSPISNWWWMLLAVPIFASLWYLKKKKSV